jgi:FixJ family two-component response regulator
MQKRPKLIAVVDDDQSMLSAAENLLDARGYRTALYKSAEDFLTSGRANEIDCLLLDIHLGGLSGIELRRQLTASNARLPVIFMTAVDNESLRQQARKSGCIALLQKPFPARQLIDALDKAVQK